MSSPKIGGTYTEIFSLKDLERVVKEAKKSGATALQIYNGDKTKTTPKYKAKFSPQDFAAAKKLLKPFVLIVHANLTLNLGNPMDSGRYHWMFDNLYADLEFADHLGAVGCVVHTGYMTNTPTEEDAIKNMVANLGLVLNKYPSKTKILIETPAGQKNRIATSIEELAAMYSQFQKEFRERIGFCVDSCHIFSVGYPIDSVKGIDDYFAKWDAAIGLDKLVAIHLNDSAKEIGSHANRHANLLEGYIFTPETLAAFLKYVRDKILILESDEDKYAHQIALVKRITAKL